MMTLRDPDRVMVQIQQWWSRSSDDPDPVQWWWSRLSDDPNPVQWWWSKSSDDPDLVQWWWSRSRDDPDLVMVFYEDPYREKIQIRWRWLEDEDDLKTRWSSWYREEDQCWKLCRKNTFLVKRECWCICNFGMYYSMYLMYCNPMFIPGCFYYVFESCGHAPMFRSGGL